MYKMNTLTVGLMIQQTIGILLVLYSTVVGIGLGLYIFHSISLSVSAVYCTGSL